MLRSQIIGGGVALLLLASLFSSGAFASGRGVLRCDSCMTVNDFSTYAEGWVLANTDLHLNGVNVYRLVVYNVTDKLLGQLSVVHFYDHETGGSSTHVRALTGTVAEMQQAYRVAIPDYGLTYVPASVATIYTGATQQQVVGPWLASYFANTNPVQGMTTLVVFPDYSSAVYQLTNAANSDWSFVHNSGYDSSGLPLDDDAQSVTMTPPPATIITPPELGPIRPGSGGGYGSDIFGIGKWVDGVIYCMVNGCTHVAGS